MGQPGFTVSASGQSSQHGRHVTMVRLSCQAPCNTPALGVSVLVQFLAPGSRRQNSPSQVSSKQGNSDMGTSEGCTMRHGGLLHVQRECGDERPHGRAALRKALVVSVQP